MLDVENFVQEHYPQLVARKPLLAKPLVKVLRLLFHEKDFQQFASDYPHLEGFDFVEQGLQFFDFSYTVRDNERERIPNKGRVVIVANHPIGSLDGLALLKLVREVRPDVKVIANELLATLAPLKPVMTPVNNMNGNTTKKDLEAIREHVEKDGADPCQ